MKLKILKVRPADFQGDEGDKITFCFCLTEGTEDGVQREIGSKSYPKVGEIVDWTIVKTEGVDGRGKPIFRYKRSY